VLDFRLLNLYKTQYILPLKPRDYPSLIPDFASQRLQFGLLQYSLDLISDSLQPLILQVSSNSHNKVAFIDS
ncbi:hypothetical protein H9Q73_014439, partial [Fusarium xylarioides]